MRTGLLRLTFAAIALAGGASAMALWGLRGAHSRRGGASKRGRLLVAEATQPEWEEALVDRIEGISAG